MNPRILLQDIGLEEKEAKIYLVLLERGESPVRDIAKGAGIKRPTAYVVLQSLEEKGFAAKVVRGKKMFFTAQHPRKLVTEAEFHLKEMKIALPQLESLLHASSGRPRIMIYQGKEELDRAFDEWLVSKGEMAYIGTLRLSTDVFPQTYRKVDHFVQTPEFSVRELLDDSPESRRHAEKVRGLRRFVRFMPRDLLPFEADICTFGNRAFITSVKKEYFTVGIESEEISRAFRAIFEIVWQSAKE